MILSWFQCAACERSVQQFKEFPLCSFCSQSLVSCPRLCNECGSPLCPTRPNQECLRFWSERGLIQSYTANYLLIGQCYSVLKRWKTRGGSSFDRQILKFNPETLATLRGHGAQAIVPIPQEFSRSWNMQGGSVPRMTAWLQTQLKIPQVEILRPGIREGTQKRQAELKLNERLENPLRFEGAAKYLKAHRPGFKSPTPIITRAILVDDFFTTGNTLRQAAHALRNLGVTQIHVFCLGLRPAMSNLVTNRDTSTRRPQAARQLNESSGFQAARDPLDASSAQDHTHRS